MPKKLIFKDSSEQFTIPAGYTALRSENGNFKKQVESTVSALITGGLSLSELGFTIVSQPSIINQDITLPDNSELTYNGPLTVGDGYTLTVPAGTTLTIL